MAQTKTHWTGLWVSKNKSDHDTTMGCFSRHRYYWSTHLPPKKLNAIKTNISQLWRDKQTTNAFRISSPNNFINTVRITFSTMHFILSLQPIKSTSSCYLNKLQHLSHVLPSTNKASANPKYSPKKTKKISKILPLRFLKRPKANICINSN